MPTPFRFSLLLAWTGLATVSIGQDSPVKSYLDPWKEGYLDIHHISTGTGESTFFQMPDGTTMLVDTGIHGRVFDEKVAKAVPSLERQPGEWVARYIRSLLGETEAKLDYVVATHFDEDHIGDVAPDLKRSASGDYQLTGLSEVVEYIPASTFLDRGYPSYDYPKPLTAEHILNYRKFVEHQVAAKGARAERFQAGRSDQITLTRRPADYPDFRIQNLAVNGDVWTGKGSESKAHFPPLESLEGKPLPSENASSLAFKLSYGAFDYYTGGDIVGVPVGKMPEWFDLETPLAQVIGPVEVAISNHHAYRDSMNETFLRRLSPRVLITLSWSQNHPHETTFPRLISKEILKEPCDLFMTSLVASTRDILGSENIDRHFKSYQGHVVIRVEPGGKQFQVFVLNDQSEDRILLASFGPYPCK